MSGEYVGQWGRWTFRKGEVSTDGPRITRVFEDLCRDCIIYSSSTAVISFCN